MIKPVGCHLIEATGIHLKKRLSAVFITADQIGEHESLKGRGRDEKPSEIAAESGLDDRIF